jgi:hypothetical protein
MTARWASAGDMLAALQRYLYGLEEPPGPRDLAALVARYCPPETRRLPTHRDISGEPALPFDATQQAAADPGAASEREPVKPGPRTAVIPREGSRPGDRRPTRARTETFATHVALEQILEGGSPPGPTEATGDGDHARGERADHDRGPDEGDVHDRPHGASTPVLPRASEKPPSIADRPTGTDQASIQLPGRMPPTASLLLLAGFGAFGLAAASIYVFYQGRGAVLRPDAAPRRDAPFLLEPDAAPELDVAEPLLDAGEPALDATAAVVRPIEAPRDAGIHLPRPDAREPRDPGEPGKLTTRIDAGAARPAGKATLTIGANPWGNVLLDGKKIGRTPIEHLSVSSGHHLVEVIFGGEDPPRTQQFPIDLADGDTRDLQADFTTP